MKKVEISKALRPPLLFGWKISDSDDDDLPKIVKLIESLSISFCVLDLNRLNSRPDLTNQIHPESASDSGVLSFVGSLKVLKNFSPLGRSDLALPNEVWSQRVVSFVKTNSFETLKTQLEWSCYVAVRSIIIDLESILTTNETDLASQTGQCLDVLDRLAHFCQIVSSHLMQPNIPTIWVALDCCNQSWNTWYMVYELCNFSEKLKVCLKLRPLETEIDIWMGEPVKAAIVSEDALVKADGRKVLAKSVSGYLSVLMRNNIKIIIGSNLNYQTLLSGLNGSEHSPPDITMGDEVEFGIKHMMKLIRKVNSKLGPLSVNELYGKGYEDLLQIPIQPLRDNLDSTTYNEFEKCSFKYNAYNTAIDAFIHHYNSSHKLFNYPNNLNSSANVVDVSPLFDCRAANAFNRCSYLVYVVGAGRGPLVEVALDVFQKNGITNYTIFAIDKNPYTMLTLQDKMWTNNWQNVKVLCTDMRDVSELIRGSRNRRPEGARDEVTLVVSELLGPFGDNELSPECLYGFENNFRPADNVHFIPRSYSSFVMPLHAPQIWAKIKSLGSPKNFHMPYTVHLRSYYCVATEFMECFRFDHPGPGFRNSDAKAYFPNCGGAGSKHGGYEENLERYKAIKFTAAGDCYVHGFGGYFKCTLFDRVQISILPMETENVKSWFPMFFPIEMPFPVKKSQTITFHIWRRTDHLRVWYEWAFTTPTTTSIHNVNGFSYSISKK